MIETQGWAMRSGRRRIRATGRTIAAVAVTALAAGCGGSAAPRTAAPATRQFTGRELAAALLPAADLAGDAVFSAQESPEGHDSRQAVAADDTLVCNRLVGLGTVDGSVARASATADAGTPGSLDSYSENVYQFAPGGASQAVARLVHRVTDKCGSVHIVVQGMTSTVCMRLVTPPGAGGDTVVIEASVSLTTECQWAAEWKFAVVRYGDVIVTVSMYGMTPAVTKFEGPEKAEAIAAKLGLH